MKNNVPSYKVSPYSGKKVWWICSICSNEWEATVDNRQRGKNCSKCSSWTGTSFSEQAICYYMSTSNVNL
ncbi:zinc-ribbon domain-containing protein [Lysinibacillus sp. NPDC097195]|uniref:zinc-ribbon domain-containing protein n=1 Tax=Lysinibacillus sp. NPDC097195 TaxID=3364141 RepID=UPI0037FE6D43